MLLNHQNRHFSWIQQLYKAFKRRQLEQQSANPVRFGLWVAAIAVALPSVVVVLNQLHSAQPAVTFDISFTQTTAPDPQITQAIVERASVMLAVGADSPNGYLNVRLNHSFSRHPFLWQVILLLTALAFTGSYLLRRQSVYQRLARVISFPALWGAIALTTLIAGWWIPIAAPIGITSLGALAIQLYERQEKQQLMALFSMNVSPGTADLIWQHKRVILNRGELEAQKLTATVLFVDIRGFTSIAETLPSQQLLPWLNQYFETMTDCVMQHGGMVDKYIGDAMMAVFGAPLPRSQPGEVRADAIAALHAALEMHERLRSLNRQLAVQALPLIEFGIGIHTGSLIGGTVGNRHRLNYSLFGDTVNIAARLESMTKDLPEDAPFQILLSADTAQHTRAHFPARLFQSGQLRGRAGYTDAYTIAAPLIATPSPYSCPKAAQPGRYSHWWANCRRCPAISQSPQRGAAQSR